MIAVGASQVIVIIYLAKGSLTNWLGRRGKSGLNLVQLAARLFPTLYLKVDLCGSGGSEREAKLLLSYLAVGSLINWLGTRAIIGHKSHKWSQLDAAGCKVVPKVGLNGCSWVQVKLVLSYTCVSICY